MKKLICILISALTVFSLFSCSAKKDENGITSKSETQISSQQSETDAAATTEKINTYTGLSPLPKVHFNVEDPENKSGLPTEKIAHSFGVAKNGKVHTISEESQKFFNSHKYNAVTYDTSGQKVLYLTFDCGYENGYTNKILDVLKEKQVTAAFFCTLPNIKAEPELIARMIKEGHIVGNHSVSHPSFAKISRTQMASEIENCDNYLREHFGYSAPYFRFPMGEYSECALELVGSLGFKCVFWSLAWNDWNTDSQKGSGTAFKTVTSRLHPGAVILLHSVSSDNAGALGDIIDYARKQGYVFKSLSDLK